MSFSTILDKITNYNTKHLIKSFTKVVCFVLLFLFLNTPALALTQQEAQNELNSINSEISSLNSSLSSLRTQKNTLANELAILDGQAAAIQLQINSAQAEINVLDAQIADTNDQITKAEADLVSQNEILKEYVKIMYMSGQTSQIELVLTSNSFSDFIDQSQYMDTMTQKVQDTTAKITNLKTELESNKRGLDIKMSQAQQLKVTQESARAALMAQVNEKNNLLAETNGNESAYQSSLKGKISRRGILECIAAGGCKGDANGALLVVNTPLHYYQWDPSWANYEYDAGSTLGNYGCLITSLAMVHGITPVQEAQRHSYSDGGLIGSTGQVVTGNWTAINSALASGKSVIFGLTMDSGYWSHFVLAKGMGDGKYYINDPYFSAGRTYSSSRVFNAIIPYQ